MNTVTCQMTNRKHIREPTRDGTLRTHRGGGEMVSKSVRSYMGRGGQQKICTDVAINWLFQASLLVPAARQSKRQQHAAVYIGLNTSAENLKVHCH
jgi:hypothetical protein